MRAWTLLLGLSLMGCKPDEPIDTATEADTDTDADADADTDADTDADSDTDVSLASLDCDFGPLAGVWEAPGQHFELDASALNGELMGVNLLFVGTQTTPTCTFNVFCEGTDANGTHYVDNVEPTNTPVCDCGAYRMRLLSPDTLQLAFAQTVQGPWAQAYTLDRVP